MINNKAIMKTLSKLNTKHTPYETLSECVKYLAFKIALRFDINSKYNKSREGQISILKNKYDEKELLVFEEVQEQLIQGISEDIDKKKYTDYLGELFMASETSNAKTGQFFTPYAVCVSMAKCSLDIPEIKKKIANNKNYFLVLYEPSVGGGANIIAQLEVLYQNDINYCLHTLTECGDLDLRCVCMTYLVLSFLGAPAIIRHQNTLSNEVWEEFYTPAYLFMWQRFEKRPIEEQIKVEEIKPIKGQQLSLFEM